MIDQFFENRIKNWARANRELPKVRKGATQAFCDSLKYIYGPPKSDDSPETAIIFKRAARKTSIDIKDANILDMAYRDRSMSQMMRRVLQLYYVKRVSPKRTEAILYLAPKSFKSVLERTVLHFKSVVESYEDVRH